MAQHVHRKTFNNAAQAETFRAGLLTAARTGEPFLIETGLPLSATPQRQRMNWYDFSVTYATTKWPTLSPTSRRGIAEALTDATEVLLARQDSPPIVTLRAALRWSYSEHIRDGGEPPNELRDAVEWLAGNTVTMEAFREPSTRSRLVRDILRRVGTTQSGGTAAANTANRKRMVMHNALEYACEIGLLIDNPLDHVRWRQPRTAIGVDPRVVINPEQAERFLAAVEAQGDRGRTLKGFFACMYYAALRPEEATELRRSSLTFPTEPYQWGELQLTEARPRSGSRWTNTGEVREQVGLKHRAHNDIRRVPMHPDLARILTEHIREFGPTHPDGRLFAGAYAGPVTDRTYLRVFHLARAAAFTPAEAASPLMGVPYALRHAAVSTWLRTTGDAALVARWAGHSVAVLLKVYAKCVDGTDQESLDRIWAATRRRPSTGPPGHK